MDLQRSRKMIRRMRKIFLTSLAMLSIVSLLFTVPVKAATYLDPSDYLVDVTADGNTKIVHYEFDDLPWLITTWNNLTQAYEDYSGQVDYGVPNGAKQVLFKTYPLGGPVYGDTLPWNGVAFDVSDILPGSPIDFDLPFHFRMTWEDNSAFGVTLTYRYGVAYYNSDGSYAGTIDGTDHTMSFISATGSRHEWEASLSVAGSIPAKAHYVVPYIELDTVFDVAVIGATVSFGGGDCDLYIDVNTVIENSNMMQSINNKLDAVGDKIDGTNDRLDEIISGGDAGDSLGAAGDKLDHSNDQAAGSMDDVGNSESDLMDDATDRLDDLNDLQISAGVGDFADSLSFVSGYLTKIFEGVEGWAVVIFLPMFLGIVMYICQYSGGLTHVVRSHRGGNDEAIAEQRSAYMKDHISRGSPSETYYVYQESLW